MGELSNVGVSSIDASSIKPQRTRDSERPGLGAGDLLPSKIPAVSNDDLTSTNLIAAAAEVEKIVNEVASTSLAFVVDEGSDRLVVRVTAVGSEEIVRQFPPEEFLTVAKFIASQQQDALSEDFLKGILFDQKI